MTKKYSFIDEELQVVTFHNSVRSFHDSLAANYIKNKVYPRLKLNQNDKVQYDVTKNEITVEPAIEVGKVVKK